MHVQRLTHVRGRSFPCCGLVGLILRYGLHGISTPCPPISPACLEAFVLAAGVCLTAAFFLYFTKTLLNFPRKCSWRPSKNKYAWARRHGKRGSSKHAGIGQPEDSCRPQARTLTGVQAAVAWRDIGLPRTSARVLAIGIAQARSWREGGALVSARCKGCSYSVIQLR